MDLPLCKICGDRHRLGGCPKFKDSNEQRRAWLKAMVQPKETADAPETSRAPQTDQHHQAQTAPEAGQPGREQAGGLPAPQVIPQEAKPKFDKNAYQRELMRKRRAAAKQSKTA